MSTESPWTHVRSDELLALHKVAQHARDAVELAAEAGIYLGPLRAALDATPYAVPRDATPGLTGPEAASLARMTGRVTTDRYGVLHDGKAG